MGNID